MSEVREVTPQRPGTGVQMTPQNDNVSNEPSLEDIMNDDVHNFEPEHRLSPRNTMCANDQNDYTMANNLSRITRARPPMKLESLRIKKVADFLHEWKNFSKHIGSRGNVFISEYITSTVWDKLVERFQINDDTDDSREVNDQVYTVLDQMVQFERSADKKLRREKMWNFEFKKTKHKSMERALHEHVMKARGMYQQMKNDFGRREILLRCIKSLPKILRYSSNEVINGDINTWEDLQDSIEKRRVIFDMLMADGSPREAISDDDTECSVSCGEEESSDNGKR